jgi:hypothetical protein
VLTKERDIINFYRSSGGATLRRSGAVALAIGFFKKLIKEFVD